MVSMNRKAYAQVFGPTKGDLVRLGDTNLLAEIEEDYAGYGYEILVGAGKTMRDGELSSATAKYSDKALDIVISQATIIDAKLGIIKADIGIRDGRIVGIGKAGNPAVTPDIHPELVVGQSTTPIPAMGYIVTAGTIETHAHMGSPEQSAHAMAGGTTTLIGSGPFETGTGTTHVMGTFLRAAEFSPLNYAVFGRGGVDPGAVEESVAAGAAAIKIHEDFGAGPATIDGSLVAADRNDFAVHLHTDSINEFGYSEDTMAACADRTIHMYHVEGAGGGHAPDQLKVNSYPNVIPGSTNPTNPFGRYATDEALPMTMIGHQLNYNTPEDLAFGEARVRPQSMAAEDYLHDMGAISIFGTDTQGMGRLYENTARCWMLASVMKDRVGRLPEETTTQADNERIKRYIAKLTINPAISIGADDHIGSLEPGKMADLVIWPRASFGIKPYMVLKAGFVVWAAMGDGNGSLPLAEPMVQRPMWGSLGKAPGSLGAVFVSKLAVESGYAASLGLDKQLIQIKSVRNLRKSDMVRNDALPHIEVDSQTFEVRADGELLMCPPVKRVPLNRRYMLR